MGLIAKYGHSTKGPEAATFAGFVGSAVAWNNFSQLADELPVEDYPELVQLIEHGCTHPLEVLESQLAKLLADRTPAGPAADVARTLLGIARDRGKADVLGIYDEYAEI